MSDSDLRDSLITAAGDRKLVALHYISEDRTESVPAIVIGHVVKVSARVVVVATQAAKNETVVPLDQVKRFDYLSGASAPAPEAA